MINTDSLRKRYAQKGLQWKIEGNPAYQAREVIGGGLAAKWFLEGYHNFGKVSMENNDEVYQ